MQPGSPHESTQPAADRDAPRSRTGLVVLIALILELAVIGGVGNQGVSGRLADYQNNRAQTDFGAELARTALSFQWRFTPQKYDVFRVLYSQFALIAVTLIVSGLLIALVTRGATGFARVFFGTWAAVLFAVVIGSIARGFVVDASRVAPGISRPTVAFFSVYGTNGLVPIAGLLLGLVVALGAGITAATGRTEPAAGPAPMACPPMGGPPMGGPPISGPPMSGGPNDSSATTVFPAAPAPGRPAGPQGPPWAQPSAASEQTRAQRPPDGGPTAFRRPSEPDATQAIQRPSEPEATQAPGPAPELDATQAIQREPEHEAGPRAEPGARAESEPQQTQQLPAVDDDPHGPLSR